MSVVPHYRVDLQVSGGRRRSTRLVLAAGTAGRNLLVDPAVIATLALALLVGGVVGWLDRRTARRYDALVEQVSIALRDSTQLDADIQLASELSRRQTDVSRRVGLVRRLDEGRYNWAHILDELALAVPGDLWIESWTELGPVPTDSSLLRFEVQGKAAGSGELSDFMQALEISPFIADVTFTNSRQENLGDVRVTAFTLQGRTEHPDPTLLDLYEVRGSGLPTDVPDPRAP